jgi:hypothetical protein
MRSDDTFTPSGHNERYAAVNFGFRRFRSFTDDVTKGSMSEGARKVIYATIAFALANNAHNLSRIEFLAIEQLFHL